MGTNFQVDGARPGDIPGGSGWSVVIPHPRPWAWRRSAVVALPFVAFGLSFLEPLGKKPDACVEAVVTNEPLSVAGREGAPDGERDNLLAPALPQPRVQANPPAPQMIKPPPSRPERVKSPNLEVQGIFLSGRAQRAIVNGLIVKAGQDIQGVRVVTIDRRGVVFKQAGRSWRVELRGR